MRLYHHKKLCWILSLALALQPVLVWQQQVAAQDLEQESVTDPKPQDQATAENLAPLIKTLQDLSDPGKLSQQLDMLEKMSKQESSAAFDVKAKANELGAGIEDIFAFVRDEVRYEVYEGVLRGPRGTLMALAGNSFDKSLLLAELLKEHGVTVRFVRGHLDAQRTESLVAKMFESVALQPKPEALNKEEAGTTPETADATEFDEASHAFVNLNIARWLSSVETVGSALRNARIAVAKGPPVPRSTLLAEATDHLWVEFKNGETWTALDPSFKDAKPGKSYAQAAVPMETVPVEAHHQVLFRLRVEARDAEGVTTRDLLQHDATASELNGSAVSLHHAVSSTDTDWSATPVLRIEDKEFPGQKISGPIGGFAGGVTDLGNRLFNRPNVETVEQGITAMWLDFEFVYPSGKKETVRRELFDRIGLVARNEQQESSAPLAELPGSGMPYPMAGAFAFSFSSGTLHPGLAQRKFAHQIPSLRKTLPNSSEPVAKDPLTAEESHCLVAGTLNLMAASSHLSSLANIRAARLAGVWGDVYFYEATPRLCIVSAVQEKPDAIGISLDLRRNDLRPVGEGIPCEKILWANITRGLLDGAMEHVLFVDAVPANPATSTPLSTIAVCDCARQGGVEFAALTDRESLVSLVVPAEAKARISAGLQDHVVLIAPKEAVRLGSADHLGWWHVNLESGETLGIMDTGLHQGASEYTAFVVGMIIGFAFIGGVAVGVWLDDGSANYNDAFAAGYKKAHEDTNSGNAMANNPLLEQK